MKTLYVFRHSQKGKDDLLTPAGKELARRQGELHKNIPFSRFFTSQLQRTRQTAEQFALGHGTNISFAGAFSGLGDETWQRDIRTPELMGLLKNGMSGYDAMYKCHDAATIQQWFDLLNTSFYVMLSSMADGETALAVTHNPLVEQVVESVLGIQPGQLGKEWHMPEMGGAIFEFDPQTEKITSARMVQPPPSV